jgi:hypothetical protein
MSVKDKLSIANLQGIPIAQTHWLRNANTIYEGAIGAAQVGEDIGLANGIKPGVIARDFAVGEGNCISTAAAQADFAPQLEHLSPTVASRDNQIWHRLFVYDGAALGHLRTFPVNADFHAAILTRTSMWRHLLAAAWTVDYFPFHERALNPLPSGLLFF